jgi:hypothetical protein
MAQSKTKSVMDDLNAFLRILGRCEKFRLPGHAHQHPAPAGGGQGLSSRWFQPARGQAWRPITEALPLVYIRRPSSRCTAAS